MALRLTEGQAGDNPQLLPLLEAVRVPRSGPGRPRKRPDHLVADKAYSHPSTRAALPGDPAHHPGTLRPGTTPGRTRTRRRPPAGVRPGPLQGPQPRRTLLQPAQTMAGDRHPLRQTRRPLPGAPRHRRHHDLAQMIRRTGPSQSPSYQELPCCSAPTPTTSDGGWQRLTVSRLVRLGVVPGRCRHGEGSSTLCWPQHGGPGRPVRLVSGGVPRSGFRSRPGAPSHGPPSQRAAVLLARGGRSSAGRSAVGASGAGSPG